MIVDSSALMAILLNESDALAIATALVRDGIRRMSAPNWLETCMNIDRRGVAEASARLQGIIQEFGIEVVAFDAGMADVARGAFLQYGKGSGHAANLNFGDCIAYALARSTDESLLFKGNDFIHTDILPAYVPALP